MASSMSSLGSKHQTSRSCSRRLEASCGAQARAKFLIQLPRLSSQVPDFFSVDPRRSASWRSCFLAARCNRCWQMCACFPLNTMPRLLVLSSLCGRRSASTRIARHVAMHVSQAPTCAHLPLGRLAMELLCVSGDEAAGESLTRVHKCFLRCSGPHGRGLSNGTVRALRAVALCAVCAPSY